MKILFLEQVMNWWFADRYPRCNMSDGIVGTRFIFLRTNKLLKNQRVFFCCGNGSAASFMTLCRPSPLDVFDKLWTAMGEHSKLGCSFQILYAFQPFSLKAFSMTAFCLSVKTILLRLSELGNWIVRVKSSNFNRLWFALQWLLALPQLLYKAKTKENKLIQGSFKCWKQPFL